MRKLILVLRILLRSWENDDMWILLIIVFNSGANSSPAVHQINFYNQKACLSAQERVDGNHMTTYCFKDR